MKLLFITILLASGCAKHRAQPEGDLLPELVVKTKLYMSAGEDLLDNDGWILADKCDALLHTALASVGGSATHENLFNARAADGRWYRRPAMDCLSKGESKSSISRDMLLALSLSILVNKDVDSAVSLYDYAVERNFVMGESDGSVDGINRVLMSPSLFIIVKAVRDYLQDGTKLAQTDKDLGLLEYGFTDHLKLISIIIRGEINTEISALDLRAVKGFTEDDPNNALAWAVRGRYDPDLGGDVSRAVGILLRPDLFPNDRLPTNRDRSAEYLWMHGENDNDWSPDDKPEQIHPGHDLTFAAWVILHE